MDFITGNNFKKICDFYLDEFGYGVLNQDKKRDVPLYFVKTDYIDLFFTKFKPNKNFILLTHNSDYHITNKYLTYLDDELLVTWFAQNVDVTHPKLKSIPIGIANEKWAHGNTEILLKIINENNNKDNLIYSNFNIHTNIKERSHCLNEISKRGIKTTSNKNFEDYLRDLSKSFFVISPNGNGVDCHKTWEALYLKTIPIVTKSLNTEFYKDYPILIIDNWSNFDTFNLNVELYYKIWDNFDNQKLTTINFLNYE